ncbi:response regulator [Flavobacterium hydatis]|uniref:Histidine kinase n=1 Tax=Flavobacterium hydatis TaxID=991 RepID=A0A086AG58_FLAHY|nr:response regulator [Flavobacterium hydatis]KFF15672.1 histidine kinase [Flavobacterium hydatis]OXA86923.1 response regulator [Flavobacterium hydatis]
METKVQFKFFIIDDNFFCANLHKQYLTNMNYNDITLFANSRDCIDNLDQNPDIIFLDHNMEDIVGLEVLKKIKSYNPNIYVIMVLRQESIKTVVDALKFGAFDYLIKGNDVNEKMTMIITKIITIREQLKKNMFGFN